MGMEAKQKGKSELGDYENAKDFDTLSTLPVKLRLNLSQTSFNICTMILITQEERAACC